MTYEEYLKSNGASDEDIRALTQGSFSGAARRAFDKLQSDLEAASTSARTATADLEAERARGVAYETTVNDWYEKTVKPDQKKLENLVIRTQAEEARAKAALKAIQERGLIDVAKDLGWTPDPPANPPGNPTLPAGFDPAKFITVEDFNKRVVEFAGMESEAIALAQDIASEHATLFPGQRLNFSQLRQDAAKANKPVMQFWEERYNVPKTRADLEAKRTKENEDRLRAEGAAAERAKLAEQYANPNVRPLVPSNSPFATRQATGRDKQPWEIGETQLTQDRVRRSTERVIKELVH